jgi:hypothetical protein
MWNPPLCVPRTSSLLIKPTELPAMIALLCFFLTLFASPFKLKSRVKAENAVLRRPADHIAAEVRGRT